MSGINPAQHLAYLSVRLDNNEGALVIYCHAPPCNKAIYSAPSGMVLPVTEVNSASTHHVNRGVELS